MKVTKIDHINIVLSDLEKGVDFFVRLLGFKVFKRGDLEGDWIDQVVGLKNVKATYVKLTLGEGKTNLELLKYHTPEGHFDESVSKANHMGLRHFALQVEGIEALYQNLKEAGVTIFSEIQTYNGSKKLVYFLGPEGVILELCEGA
jgi:catechol 2,3-dioxygenase-like lactoylglutathione lyase family enzyme